MEINLDEIDCEELLGNQRDIDGMSEEQVRNLLEQALRDKIKKETDIVNLYDELERARQINAGLRHHIEERLQANNNQIPIPNFLPERALDEVGHVQMSPDAARAVVLKPRQFHSQENFRNYLHGFKIFCKAAQIPAENRVDTLLTYLDHATLRKVRRIGFNEMDKTDPEKCFDQITNSIMGKIPTMAVKIELEKQVQNDGEGISSFASRLLEMAEIAYPKLDAKNKDVILTDIFVKGLANEKILYKILDGCETRSFDENYKMALAHEGVIFTTDQIEKNKLKKVDNLNSERDTRGVFQITDTEGDREQCWNDSPQEGLCNQCAQWNANQEAEMYYDGMETNNEGQRYFREEGPSDYIEHADSWQPLSNEQEFPLNEKQQRIIERLKNLSTN